MWLLPWTAHEVQCCAQLVVWTVNLCYVRKISPCWIPCLFASWQLRGKRRYSERIRMETSILRLKKLKSLTLKSKQGRHNNGMFPKQQGNQWNLEESDLQVDKSSFPDESRSKAWNSLPLDVTEDKNFILFLLGIRIDAQKMKYLIKITGTSGRTKIKVVWRFGLDLLVLMHSLNPRVIKITGDFAVFTFESFRWHPKTFSIRYNLISLWYQYTANSCELGRNICLFATCISTDYVKLFDILVWHN